VIVTLLKTKPETETRRKLDETSLHTIRNVGGEHVIFC